VDRTHVEILFFVLGLVGAVPTAYLLVNAYLGGRRPSRQPRREVPLSEITILTPVHDQTPEVFSASIASVARQGCAFVVVGDGCVEPYRSLTEELGGTFLPIGSHVGKKGAFAAGLPLVRTSYVLLVDSDTVLPDRAARDLVAHFAPGVGGVGANLSVKDTGHPVAVCSEFVERAREVVLRAMSTRGSVLYLDGACAMYRTELIRSFVTSSDFQDLRVLGRPSPLGDDWQLTDHLLRAGFTTVKAYDVRVVTYPQESFPAFVRQNVRWARSNWIRLGHYLAGRGPKDRTAFFTFEVIGTYALPLIALATLLVRVPFWWHDTSHLPATIDGAARFLLHGVIGLPRSVVGGVMHVGLMILGAFATGFFLGTLMSRSRHPTLRMITFGAVGTVILFVTTVYGLVTFWKRPRWAGPRPPGLPGAPTIRSDGESS
jgi:cellulose synthase/poly-beta-1,6-N-acetylglucosamine synthase-like glycosyltransferase